MTTTQAAPTFDVGSANVSGIAVEMLGIDKRFGAVQANSEVDLKVMAGTVHGIVGENGAGKSTLMSVLYGFYTADTGTIKVAGRAAVIRNAHDAISLGIGMVHQHFMLVDTLTALENVMLGAESSFLLSRSEGTVRSKLKELIDSTGLKVELDAQVDSLPVGDRQRLEILKALYRGAKILILDEPTAVLTPQETEQLFGVLSRLREQGTTILLITHKLKEVMRLCDHVTVMRGGRVVQEVAIAQTSIESLAEAMVGRKVHMGRQGDASKPAGDVLLQVKGVVVRDALKVTRLHGLDVSLKAGEIVGIAGVSGNGQSEMLEVMSGLLAPQEGHMEVGGTSFDAGAWMDPRTARKLGVAHVPEDRHERAMVMSFEAWESAVLGYEWLPQYCHAGWMRHDDMRKATVDMMDRFDVRPRNDRLLSASFSGGNQQKLVLARELGQAPKVLLVGQPTRGVDIGAIEFIYSQLRSMRDAGCAVLVVSSELDEILALSDRVIVLNQGRVTGELPIDQCTESKLGMLMLGSAT